MLTSQPARTSVRFASLLLAGAAFAQRPRVPLDDAIAALGKDLAAYAEARASGSGLDAARATVGQRMEALRAALGSDPLQHPAELGRAVLASRAHADLQGPGAQQVSSEAFPHANFPGGSMGYAYRLPRDYDPRRAYPLLLAIPGEEEQPAEHIRANWTERELLEGVIVVAPAMPAQRETWERVTVQGRPGGLAYVLTALRVAIERFAVDPERVFVAGRGKAVPAALAAGNYAPQRFAGIIGLAGDAGTLRPDNFGALPTFFAGGGANARAFGEAAKGAGFDNSVFKADATEQDVWKWMLAHPRQTYPERVQLVPGDPFPTRAYWLQVAPSAADCRTVAEIDRVANTVRIEARGVARVTLFLNDALVDLARPVRVLVNGVAHEALVPRSLSSFLDLLLDETSDAGAVYVARAEYDPSAAADTGAGAVTEPDAELDQRVAAAGDDVAKLWDLQRWCAASQRDSVAERLLRTIVRLDPEHEGAHTALGHVRSGERWFASPASLARFRGAQDPESARARGLVEYKSLWMHRDERALAVKGWQKDPESGLWLTPADKKRLAEGWVRQDMDWIRPHDAQRLDEGLWFVDGEWLDLAHANRRHAAIDSMWCIPGAEVVVHSTTDREVALRAQVEMGRALADLRRVFGVEPVLPLHVAVLRDEEQYDRFAFGDPDGRRPATHAGRLHVVHSAFFAESWFPRVEGKREFRGMGVCFWESQVPNGDLYGVHAARLAVGLSYVDALDPSPNAVRKALAAGPGPEYYAAYTAEKELPAWLRWGAAVYAERYFEDVNAPADGDRWWARNWSLENLRSRGGMRELAAVLAFELDPDDREDALKLLIEAGLLVAFVVDGHCAPVDAEHAAFVKSLAGGEIDARRVAALTEAVVAHEAELRAFAGL